MILLDTNAVLFLEAGHRRARALARFAGSLHFSPITLLELRMLAEVGKGTFSTGDAIAAARASSRWIIDDPPLEAVVARSLPLGWTRDPFDRLLAGHALYRGWRLATSDRNLLEHLDPGSVFEL